MARFEEPKDYFYSGSHNQVLQNTSDIQDLRRLQSFDYKLSALRRVKIIDNPSLIPRTYDITHLCAIHYHLFDKAYEWAGQLRNANIGRNDDRGRMRAYAQMSPEGVGCELARVFDLVHRTDWARLDRDQLPAELAKVYAHLNYAHPFREGNERTAKIFMEHVAEKSNFSLDFALVEQDELNRASVASLPQGPGQPVRPEELMNVFRWIIVDRTYEVPVDRSYPITIDRTFVPPAVDLPYPLGAATQVRLRLEASYPRAPRMSSSTGQQSTQSGDVQRSANTLTKSKQAYVDKWINSGCGR